MFIVLPVIYTRLLSCICYALMYFFSHAQRSEKYCHLISKFMQEFQSLLSMFTVYGLLMLDFGFVICIKNRMIKLACGTAERQSTKNLKYKSQNFHMVFCTFMSHSLFLCSVLVFQRFMVAPCRLAT